MTYDNDTDDLTESDHSEIETAAATNGLYESAAADESDENSDDSDDSDAPIELEPESTEIGDVRAESVTITQGGANSVEATTVSITQGGAAQVRADDLSVSQGGVAVARTESLTVGEGGSAFAVMSDTATVHEGGNVFMLIARSTSGEGRPFLDWRAALAFGAGLAVVLRLLRRS